MASSIKSYENQIASLNAEKENNHDTVSVTDSEKKWLDTFRPDAYTGEKVWGDKKQPKICYSHLTEVSKNNTKLEEKINAAVQMNKSYTDSVTNSVQIREV